MMMTGLIRPCLVTAPMFGVSAPTPGTGKSKLVDIASILVTGEAAAVLSAPRDESEMHKQVSSVFMAGDQFISLDNVEYPLRSEFLCQALTQTSITCRVLGESRTVKLPTAATFCATGNSLRFAGDLTRRVVLINLDARVERPEERVFPTDIVSTAKQRRVMYVIAALTVLRAFVVHNGPKVVPPMGSFESWSERIRSALMWLGEADPIGNARKVRDNDPERERAAAILAALPSDHPWTVAETARAAALDGPLREVLVEFFERNGQFGAMRFGQYLRKQTNRIVDGKRVIFCGKDRNKVALWRVEHLSESATAETPDW